MRTAISSSWFVPIGSRSSKGSNTIHVLREERYTDKRGTAFGKAFCGAEVQTMDFPEDTVKRNLCKRCEKGATR